MGALAITQALGLGSRGPLPALQSLTPLVLLPAFPIAVVAALRNRRALALTAAGVAVALLVLAAPIAFPGHRPAVAADATRLRITFANLFRENQDPSAAAAVMAHDADVVAVVELNPVMATHLEAAAAGRYRYQLAQPTFGSRRAGALLPLPHRQRGRPPHRHPARARGPPRRRRPAGPALRRAPVPTHLQRKAERGVGDEPRHDR